LLAGVCRRLLESVTLHGGPTGGFTRAGRAMASFRLQSNYSSTATLHGGPVVVRPARATPCLFASMFFRFRNDDNSDTLISRFCLRLHIKCNINLCPLKFRAGISVPVLYCLLLYITSPAGAVAKYCDKYDCVCVSCLPVCLYVRENISRTTRVVFINFCACCLVLLRFRCDTLCTSGFVDDIMFVFYNGTYILRGTDFA